MDRWRIEREREREREREKDRERKRGEWRGESGKGKEQRKGREIETRRIRPQGWVVSIAEWDVFDECQESSHA